MAERTDDSRTVLRFGGFVLDPAAWSLEGPEGPIPVEPRVLEVLHCVVTAGGRLVSKDELAEAVWRDEAPSDAAISRAVHHARKALGEDGRSARILVTVHGRGFRLGPEIDVDEVSDGGGRPPGPEVEPSVEPARARDSKVVGPAPRLLGGLALVLLAAGLLWSVRPDPSSPPPPVRRSTRLAIVPTGTELPDLAICELLTWRLEALPGVLVRDCDLSRRASIEAPSLTGIARLVGADVVVSGQREPLPSAGHRLRLALYGIAADGAVERFDLASVEADGLSELCGATEDLASEISAVIGDGELPEPLGAFPAEPAALAAGLRGLQALRRGGCGDATPLDLLTDAAETEPRFVAAWAGLAEAHRRRASDCGFHRRHYRSALEAIERARDAGPGLSGGLVALRARVLTESGDPVSAWHAIREAEDRGLADPRLDLEASRLLVYAGFPEAALERLERSRRGDPGLDRSADAPALTDLVAPAPGPGEIVDRLRPSPRHFFRAGLLAIARGDEDAALAALTPAFRADPADHFARLAEALRAILEGKRDDARRILAELARGREAGSSGDPLVDHRTAQLRAWAGDRSGALESLGRAIDGGFHCADCLQAEPGWEDLRSDAGFSAAVSRSRRRSASLSDALEPATDGLVRNP